MASSTAHSPEADSVTSGTMPDIVLDSLIQDGNLVAEVGIQLGKIKDSSLFRALSDAKSIKPNSSAEQEVVIALHKAIRTALDDISPITLTDLKGGWRPFQESRSKYIGIVFFGVFSLFLLILTSYMTQIYHRASLLYDTTVELQNDKGAEQAVRLFGMLKKNEKDVFDSLNGGSKDFLYEAFNKSLSDLEVMSTKAQSYYPVANESLSELDFGTRLVDTVLAPARWLFPNGFSGGVTNSGDEKIDSLIKSGRYGPNSGIGLPKNIVTSCSDAHIASKPNDLNSRLRDHFACIRDFMAQINVGFDPVVPPDYSVYLFRFQQGLSLLGLWILPGLYGSLGAVIYLMRRVLDPSLPSPTWIRFPFRVILGGFAGIIVVWLWGPSTGKSTQPVFASLGSFGLAFVIGYSTDVLFQLLDRVVLYMSQVVGKVGS